MVRTTVSVASPVMLMYRRMSGSMSRSSRYVARMPGRNPIALISASDNTEAYGSRFRLVSIVCGAPPMSGSVWSGGIRTHGTPNRPGAVHLSTPIPPVVGNT